MRRAANLGFLGLTTVALSLGAPLPAVSHPHPDHDSQGSQGLCRRAAPLPPLPPEVSSQQQWQRPRPESGPVYAPSAPPPPPPPPPAPMAPPMAETRSGAAASDSAEIAVTGSRIERPGIEAPAPVTVVDSARAPSLPPPHRPRPYPQPQPGLLTAGDHDDLLNPELYALYARGFQGRSNLQAVPRLDTRRVLTVAVQDERGRPVPFAEVKLTCADGNSLSLATLADGTAAFFPELDRLGDSVRLSVRAGGREAGGGRTILLAGQPGAQRHAVTVAAPARAIRKFDLLVAIDTTGSMGDEIAFLKSELHSILDALKRTHPQLDMRLSLVAYRDEGDEYVTRTYPFTSSLAEMQARLAGHYADGGGDYPEAMDQALARAVQQQWRPDAVKSLLLVADAPPHDPLIGRTWAAAEAARAKRIQIVPVAASGVADTAEYVMRAMAAATQSRYLFLTDDSGIGNPHAPPAIDCYLVTRLNALVRRVLDSQISGRRIEPREGEVIRSVGQYEGGKCILPPDFRVQG